MRTCLCSAGVDCSVQNHRHNTPELLAADCPAAILQTSVTLSLTKSCWYLIPPKIKSPNFYYNIFRTTQCNGFKASHQHIFPFLTQSHLFLPFYFLRKAWDFHSIQLMLQGTIILLSVLLQPPAFSVYLKFTKHAQLLGPCSAFLSA